MSELRFSFDGSPVTARPGQSLAAALTAAGYRRLGETGRRHALRDVLRHGHMPGLPRDGRRRTGPPRLHDDGGRGHGRHPPGRGALARPSVEMARNADGANRRTRRPRRRGRRRRPRGRHRGARGGGAGNGSRRDAGPRRAVLQAGGGRRTARRAAGRGRGARGRGPLLGGGDSRRGRGLGSLRGPALSRRGRRGAPHRAPENRNHRDRCLRTPLHRARLDAPGGDDDRGGAIALAALPDAAGREGRGVRFRPPQPPGRPRARGGRGGGGSRRRGGPESARAAGRGPADGRVGTVPHREGHRDAARPPPPAHSGPLRDPASPGGWRWTADSRRPSATVRGGSTGWWWTRCA